MVTVVVCPAIHVVGEMEEMVCCTSVLQLVCAWQIVGENSRKSVAAWRSGPGIAPPICPRACAWVRSFQRVGDELSVKSGSKEVYMAGWGGERKILERRGAGAQRGEKT